jgi:excisionase family DNA binding protein
MSTIAIQIPLRLQYPIEESAALLGISKHTLIRDIRRGVVKTTRYGKRVPIPKDELLRIAAEGMQPEAKPERGTAPALDER